MNKRNHNYVHGPKPSKKFLDERGFKECTRCHVFQSLEDYPTDSGNSHNHFRHPQCKECRKITSITKEASLIGRDLFIIKFNNDKERIFKRTSPIENK